MVMMSWLLHEQPLSPEDELALGVLDHLLMGTPTSTLYKPMIESGLGAAVMGGGVSDELKQATFSVGLKGIKADDVPKVEARAHDPEGRRRRLRRGRHRGVAQRDRVLDARVQHGRLPQGPLGHARRDAALALQPPGTPADALRFEKPLAALNSASPAAKVFEGLLERLLVKNEHLATVELVPARRSTSSRRRRRRRASPRPRPRRRGHPGRHRRHQGAQGGAAQGGLAGDLATIPRVTTADLEREVKTVTTNVDASLAGGAGTLLTHPLPAAGVVYADVLLDLSKVGLDELPYVRFLSQILDEVGTGTMDAVQMQRRIGARTGGISPAMIYEQPTGAGGAIADPRTWWRTSRCGRRRARRRATCSSSCTRSSPTPTWRVGRPRWSRS